MSEIAPTFKVARHRALARQSPPTHEVSDTQLQQHEDWLRQQYLRDLDTLGRIEDQRGLDSDVDFFGATGAIHSGR